MVNGIRVSASGETDKKASDAMKAKIKALRAPAPAAEMPTLADYVYSVIDGPYRERAAIGAMTDKTWTLCEGIFQINIKNHPIGALPLDEVTPIDVELWIAGLRRQARIITSKDPKTGEQVRRVAAEERPALPATKRRYAGFLSGVFERARKVDKLITSNPVRDAEKPSAAECVTTFRILTAAEIRELLALCDGKPARYRLIVKYGLHGLGPAEMAGQRYEDFKETRQGAMIHVERQAQGGKVVERPGTKLKTRNRTAWVAIDKELASLLRGGGSGFVLGTESGTPISEANIARAFRQLVKGTKFKDMSPYDLRHTFAMRMLESGVDIRTAAEQLRNSPEVFLKTYVRSRDDLKVAAIRKVERTGSINQRTNQRGPKKASDQAEIA